MRTRRHFNPQRVCSSDNYKLSIKAHQNYEKRTAIVEAKKSTVEVFTKYYIKVFGELVEITKEEAIRLKKSLTIIAK